MYTIMNMLKNGTYTIKLNNANLDKGWFVTEAIFGDYSSYLATCCLSGNFYGEQLPSILETVVLNEGLRVINYGALVDCTELKTLTIPSTVVEIGQNAFDNCTSLEKVYIKAIIPPERTKFGPSTPELKPIFGDDDNLRAIYVPEGSVDAYKTAWHDYAHLIRRFPMFKIDEHIATITIEDEAVVQFSRQHPVYGIKGDNIKASFEEDFEDTDQGVYDTSATGTTIMENHQQKDTIYLKGTGTVTVWAGLSAVNFPFKAQGKGGGSGGGTIYRTTTALTDGATTNPITVDGEPVTVKSGDFAIYSKAEFVFDGTQWDELGDTSGLGDLAYKDSASGTASVSVKGTTDGSVTISPTKETIYSTTNKGTLPSFTYNSTTEELTFNAGTLPSTTAKSVVTNATATFTGASTTSTGTVNVTVS